jgi:ribosome-binding factor A
MSIRTEQVESNLQKILGELFIRDVELPQDHLATISRVSVSPDLKTAKVFVSVLPFDSSEEVMAMLKSQKSQIQKEAHEQLSMKFSPVLEFVLDTKQEEASEIEKLIDEEVGLFDV